MLSIETVKLFSLSAVDPISSSLNIQVSLGSGLPISALHESCMSFELITFMLSDILVITGLANEVERHLNYA